MQDMPMDEMPAYTDPVRSGRVVEFPLAWPGAPAMPMPMAGHDMATDPYSCCLPGGGSTHELVVDPDGSGFWVSGQNYDHLARITLDGAATFFPMCPGSRPHGTVFDTQGRLWVTFEGLGRLARIAADGSVAETIDVAITSDRVGGRFNPHPHGLTCTGDGALWFTGKLSNTVGRVDPGGRVEHFVLPAIGAVPIYLSPGPDGRIWCTELGAGNIAAIAPDGTVSEIAIPTPNSRPITIKPGPDGRSMWFTQEAGGRIGRIDMAAPDRVVEYPVPLTHRDAILAGHAFDAEGHLWVQQYISPPAYGPTGDDYVIRIDKTIAHAAPGDLSDIPITYFRAPSQRTVMHRITPGPDGNIWFSELGLNRVGRIDVRSV